MEYVVVIDAGSPYGEFLLAGLNKLGGSSGTFTIGGKAHPQIVCSGLDWGTAPSFLCANHLRNPQDTDLMPLAVIVPCRYILLAVAVDLTAATLAGDQSVVVH